MTRLLHQPTGITRTGWPAVEHTCREKLGISFDRWQDGAGRLILAERADGSLAATVGGVGMSLPRQVGKTYLLAGLIFGLCINKPNLLVIWSAHHSKTHAETFLAMQAFAKRSKVAPYIAQGPRGPMVFTGSGDEEIRFTSGSRILFGARERGFGRGIPGVDILVMDEAQILSDRAMDNMVATLNTSRFGLQLYIGTPPKPEDNSEAFRQMRQQAMDGDPDTAWIECGCAPGADPDDRGQYEIANPSHPHRTPLSSILRMRKKLTTPSFLREALGIWDDFGKTAAFSMSDWIACQGKRPDGLAMSGLALAVSADLDAAAVVAAGVDGDLVHVRPLQHGPGTGWIADRLKVLQEARGVDVVVDPKSPATSLIPVLEREGVRLRVVKSDEVFTACGTVDRLVREHRLRHESYAPLDAAVERGERRDSVGRWAWRRRSGLDASTLEAATLAAWQASNPETPRVSAYETRGVLTV